MPLSLLDPFAKISSDGDNYIYLFVVRRILNIVLELNPPLPLSKDRDLKMMGALLNAINKFKAIYYAKYKQGIADYSFGDQELYIALGKELKEKNELEFNKLIKELNDPQWTLLLTGKIYEVKALGTKIDSALTELFTKDGIVEGAKQINTKAFRVGLGLKDNHFYLKDGQLHTIHIYNNADADKSTGIYIPKEFSQIEFIDGSESSVVCINPTTKQIIRASHILIEREIQFKDTVTRRELTVRDKAKLNEQLKTNIKTPPNARGSLYIGETGGPGGADAGYVHSHLTIFKDRSSMQTAIANKYAKSTVGEDYNSKWKVFLGDFRLLVKIA